MRKKISIFLCVMMVFVMSTGVAMAKTVNEKGQHNNSNYEKTYTGTGSKFSARAAYDEVYTAIENTSNYNRYLICTVRPYKANIGWLEQEKNASMELPGIQINISMERDKEMVGYYFHTADCDYNEHSGVSEDSYAYSAYQWYYKN